MMIIDQDDIIINWRHYKIEQHIVEKMEHNNIINYLKNNIVDELMKIFPPHKFIDTFKILKYNNHDRECVNLYNFINKNYKINLVAWYETIKKYLPSECQTPTISLTEYFQLDPNIFNYLIFKTPESNLHLTENIFEKQWLNDSLIKLINLFGLDDNKRIVTLTELKEKDIITLNILIHYPIIISTIIGYVEEIHFVDDHYKVTINCGSEYKIKLYETRKTTDRDHYINTALDDPYQSVKILCPIYNKYKSIYTGNFYIEVFESPLNHKSVSYHKMEKPYSLFYHSIMIIRKYSLPTDNIPTELKELINPTITSN